MCVSEMNVYTHANNAIPDITSSMEAALLTKF